MDPTLSDFKKAVTGIPRCREVGRVTSVDGHTIRVSGLHTSVRLNDRLRLFRSDGHELTGEVIAINDTFITMLPDTPPTQVATSDRVIGEGPALIAPCKEWTGRVINPFGVPLDHHPIKQGPQQMSITNNPPPAIDRKGFGPRLSTGFHLFNTILPIVRGQRVGIFAGSGTGKTTLLAELAQSLSADVVVLALVGERGREIRNFRENALGPEATARTVIVAASADAPATHRFRCPITAMRIAEYFRDLGNHVLLVADSLTRFAEAHREITISAGEFPGLKGFAASTPQQLTMLAERAGPGTANQGDITAVFSVLVAASDMDEPISDMLRGVLDGHILLERNLAERGVFPAVDILRSVSRALPDAATPAENSLIAACRNMLSQYEESKALIDSGLYTAGSNDQIDKAISFNQRGAKFLTQRYPLGVNASFEALAKVLTQAGASQRLSNTNQTASPR